MERIVTKTIPAAVINNPRVDWNPVTNAVRALAGEGRRAAGRGARRSRRAEREPDARYARWLGVFQAERAGRSLLPDAPTLHRPPLRRWAARSPRRG